MNYKQQVIDSIERNQRGMNDMFNDLTDLVHNEGNDFVLTAKKYDIISRMLDYLPMDGGDCTFCVKKRPEYLTSNDHNGCEACGFEVVYRKSCSQLGWGDITQARFNMQEACRKFSYKIIPPHIKYGDEVFYCG